MIWMRLNALWLLLVIPSCRIQCYLHDDKSSQCRQWQDEFAKNQATVTAELPPDVQGKWASESCEVRPGPNFLLRRYQFFSNHSFLLHQFYYLDESCTLPSYSITIWGRYHFTKISWVVPGAMEAEYVPTRINLVAYSTDIAEYLVHEINHSCPTHIRSNWRPYKRYRIYSYVEGGNGSQNDVFEDYNYNCLDSFHHGFNELQLIRVQHKKALHYRHKPHPMRVELFLGAVHSDPHIRFFNVPTSYQAPLLNVKCGGCHVCSLISKSHELSPPQLPNRARLPVYLSGEWISTTCEVRPYGMFLHRHLKFNDNTLTWKGIYQYYKNPTCTSLMFTVEVEGKFKDAGISYDFPGAVDYNFNIRRLYITPHEASFVRNLNGHRNNTCGLSGSWLMNITQDVTWTGGCLGLKLRAPIIEYSVLRIDVDHHGNTLLYLGQENTDFISNIPPHRPTTYQPPLVQCRHIQDNHLDNHLYPLPHALYLASQGPCVRVSFWLIVALMVLCF